MSSCFTFSGAVQSTNMDSYKQIITKRSQTVTDN